MYTWVFVSLVWKSKPKTDEEKRPGAQGEREITQMAVLYALCSLLSPDLAGSCKQASQLHLPTSWIEEKTQLSTMKTGRCEKLS